MMTVICDVHTVGAAGKSWFNNNYNDLTYHKYGRLIPN